MPTPNEILKKYWGFDTFRPLQKEIIQSVLDGRDTLALLPTGGGKSICYQVPALVKEGITVVISPLIALMKDQVENLRKLGIKSEAIFSGMHIRDIDRILDNCAYGDIQLLYLSPERLLNYMVIERIKKMNINLLAVDEAHCISQWGYDFRPPYLQIADIREFLPKGTPILALTATATADVAKDIQEKLNFKTPNVFQGSFIRDNLSYSVLYVDRKEEKLTEILINIKGTAIVYARNRRMTKEIAAHLQKHNINADFYHAGLEMDVRTKKQDAWKSGKTRVMVSTNAFGMGIDKPDVRVVVHMDLPESLEAYYQEAGRAGRDGQKSYAVLLYNQGDRKHLEYVHEVSFPSMDVLRQTYRALSNFFQLGIGTPEGASFEFDFNVFVKTYRLHALTTMHAIRVLQQEGWLLLSESFYLPSSMMFKVDRAVVYEYLLQNPGVENLLKTLLRAAQGQAFLNFVNLNESSIASFLKVSQKTLQQQIAYIAKAGIIDYRPQTENPRITFLQERVAVENLSIDFEAFNFRKNRLYERITKAIQYADNKACRSLSLVQYFGEESNKTCGICDVCLGRHQVELSAADFERYKEKILSILAGNPTTEKILFQSFSFKHHSKVKSAIAYLIDEGILELNGQNYQLLADA